MEGDGGVWTRAGRPYLLLLCGSEAQVVEDLRLQGAEGLQQSRDESGRVRLQSATCGLADLHQGLDAGGKSSD